MDRRNHTAIKEFILVGFSEVPELQHLLFVVFLCIFTMSLSAHMFLILLYRFSPNLQTPMYFFLANFSFLEICYILTIGPNMLGNLLSEHKIISFYGCALQMYLFLLFAGSECYMLASMAYDRYNAICHPLLYSILMHKATCVQLICGSWIIGMMVAIIQTMLMFSLPFCGSHAINHFFCDIPPIMALACADTQVHEVVTFIITLSVIVGSFVLTVISYSIIILTIVKRHSASGRKKAFSTCTSHLIVVTIFYGSGSVMYLRPKSSYGTAEDKFISLMYAIIAPLLNPFIYSFRNNDVIYAVRRIVHNIKLA
ncbi:olfactory receptor 10A7-like [Hyla sarda]|uniref:olfactory receptor 10A7-like n=1 Tax=Hyla sarda TaxID=327740 RepID=UPI0024C3E656|nr:olfactory receptor 10A7-like [Hyla sarda]